MKKDDDSEIRAVQIEQLFQFGDSGGSSNIDKRVYDLIVRLSLENVSLNTLWRNKEISDDEFARRRKILFHKLAGQYAAAKLILQASLPFDKTLFQDLVVDDSLRRADFDLLKGGKLSSEDYFRNDRMRIERLVLDYRDEIRRREKSGEPIKDKSHLFA